MPDPTLTTLDLNNLPTDPAAAPPADNKPARPEHIPEKFWDSEKGEVRIDDLAKSYAELEKGRGAAPKDPAAKPQIPTEGDDPAKQVVENAGLDWAAVQKQVVDSGTLDDASIAAIEKLGVPREMIDGYLEMAKEVSASITVQANAHVGGEEKMAALMEWAGKNLPDERKVEFNNRLGTRDGWKNALTDLMALQQAGAKTAGEPSLGDGGRPDGGNSTGYASREEMQRDMSDPRYGLLDPMKADPTFRAMVAARVAATTRQ